MLIKKSIQIDFASPRLKAADAFTDLRKAVKSASLNLYSRHNVRLQELTISKDEKVILEMDIPEEIASTFNIGNHLRGLSKYLISQCNGKYNQYLIGNRLLIYTELTESALKAPRISMQESLSAIADFANLLSQTDEESMDKISRIMLILKENRSNWY